MILLVNEEPPPGQWVKEECPTILQNKKKSNRRKLINFSPAHASVNLNSSKHYAN